MSIANGQLGKRTKKFSPDITSKYNRSKRLLVIILSLIVIGTVIFFATGGVVDREEARLNEYLNNKYGQEFVVENLDVTGSTLGNKGAWTAKAYLKSDPSLMFDVRKSQTTGEITKDTFLQTLWSRQGQNEVRAFMTTTLPNHEGFLLTITPGNHSGIASYDSIQGTTPTLREALEKYRDGITYRLSVNDVVDVTNDEPSVASLENAMKVAEFVKSKGVGVPSMNYGYRDTSFTERNNSGEQKYQYSIELEREVLKKVSTPNDLKQFFEIIEY